jgi:predicted nucleotidyltransferase
VTKDEGLTLQIDRERLNEIAQQFGLDLIVLFGSHAKGRAIPGSDVDIAVRAIKRPWGDWNWEFAVEAALAEAVKAKGSEVDVVFLNGASSLLMFEVACSGQVLYEKEWGVFSDFKSYAARRYYDDEPRFNRQAEYLRAKAV